MEDIVFILMVFGIPMSAVIGHYVIKYKKLSMGEMTSEDKKMLAQALHENKELRNRLQNMETIVGEIDTDLLKLNSHSTPTVDEQLNKLKQEQIIKK